MCDHLPQVIRELGGSRAGPPPSQVFSGHLEGRLSGREGSCPRGTSEYLAVFSLDKAKQRGSSKQDTDHSLRGGN